MDLEATLLAFAGSDAVVQVTIHADVSISSEYLQGDVGTCQEAEPGGKARNVT